MKLTNLLNLIFEEKDIISHINIIGVEIDGNQTKEKSLRLDVLKIKTGSVRKNFKEFLENFISGQITIKFVVDGKTLQINTLKKNNKITFIEIDLNPLSDNEFKKIIANLKISKIKFQQEDQSLKIFNSTGYTVDQFITLIINVIKIIITSK